MKEQGLPVENYVAPNTLTNGDGEEFEANIICSHEGHKKMDDRALMFITFQQRLVTTLIV